MQIYFLVVALVHPMIDKTNNKNNRVRIERKHQAHVSMGRGICSELPRARKIRPFAALFWYKRPRRMICISQNRVDICVARGTDTATGADYRGLGRPENRKRRTVSSTDW